MRFFGNSGALVDASQVCAITMHGPASGPWSLGVISNGGNPNSPSGLATFTTLANLATALDTFTESQGTPWLAVGDPTTYVGQGTNGHVATVAVNLTNVTDWTSNDTGYGPGVQFSANVLNGVLNPTPGYEPWPDFSTTSATLEDILGVYTFISE